MSTYRLTIDETSETIELRARYYRDLVIGVVILGVASTSTALVFRAWSPLSGFLLLIPVCGLFFCRDARLLASWRSRLLERWASGQIEFWALREAFRPVTTLPKQTLGAMLGSLPVVGNREAEQVVPLVSRTTSGAVVDAIYACRADVLALKTSASAALVVPAIGAVWLKASAPLLLTGLALTYPLLRAAAVRFRLRVAYSTARKAAVEPTFSYRDFERLVNDLDWRPISATAKHKFMMTIRSDAHS
jgi:hypothetical protein